MSTEAAANAPSSESAQMGYLLAFVQDLVDFDKDYINTSRPTCEKCKSMRPFAELVAVFERSELVCAIESYLVFCWKDKTGGFGLDENDPAGLLKEARKHAESCKNDPSLAVAHRLKLEQHPDLRKIVEVMKRDFALKSLVESLLCSAPCSCTFQEVGQSLKEYLDLMAGLYPEHGPRSAFMARAQPTIELVATMNLLSAFKGSEDFALLQQPSGAALREQLRPVLLATLHELKQLAHAPYRTYLGHCTYALALAVVGDFSENFHCESYYVEPFYWFVEGTVLALRQKYQLAFSVYQKLGQILTDPMAMRSLPFARFIVTSMKSFCEAYKPELDEWKDAI